MKIKCLRCKGTGWEWMVLGDEAVKDICPNCLGEGVVTEPESSEDDDAGEGDHDTLYNDLSDLADAE